MTLTIELRDKEVVTDPVAAIFRASVLIADHAVGVRNRAQNTTVDVGNGKTGTVCSVDTNNMHVKCDDGTRHVVPWNQKRLSQLAEPPRGGGGASSSSSSSASGRKSSARRGATSK